MVTGRERSHLSTPIISHNSFLMDLKAQRGEHLPDTASSSDLSVTPTELEEFTHSGVFNKKTKAIYTT